MADLGATKKKESSKTLDTISPSQRAAIVIAMLGEEAAKPIVDLLDDAELANIASGLDALALLGKDELAEVVVDFLAHLRNTSGGFVSGKATTKDLVANIMNFRSAPKEGGAAEQADEAAGDGAGGGDNVRDVWGEVEKFPPEQIAEYLNGLTPNLIAIVMNKLPVTTASEIFGFLDNEKLKTVMKFMVEAQALDPRMESVVDRMIEMEFLNSKQEGEVEDGEHLAGIGEMLSLMSSETRDPLVQFLETDHANKIDAIQGALFTIDSLPETLPRNAVPIVFRDMSTGDTVELLSTLQGELAPVAEFFLSNISSRLAGQIKEELSGMEALSAEAAELTQRSFLMRIMTLKRSGEITI